MAAWRSKTQWREGSYAASRAAACVSGGSGVSKPSHAAHQHCASAHTPTWKVVLRGVTVPPRASPRSARAKPSSDLPEYSRRENEVIRNQSPFTNPTPHPARRGLSRCDAPSSFCSRTLGLLDYFCILHNARRLTECERRGYSWPGHQRGAFQAHREPWISIDRSYRFTVSRPLRDGHSASSICLDVKTLSFFS